jgi:hypothetical protein
MYLDPNVLLVGLLIATGLVSFFLCRERPVTGLLILLTGAIYGYISALVNLPVHVPGGGDIPNPNPVFLPGWICWELKIGVAFAPYVLPSNPNLQYQNYAISPLFFVASILLGMLIFSAFGFVLLQLKEES